MTIIKIYVKAEQMQAVGHSMCFVIMGYCRHREEFAMREITAFLKSRQPVNLIIVAINVIVFVVLSLMGDTEDGFFMAVHGACLTMDVVDGKYYELVTSMFLHFGVEHLFYNMLVLIFLGDTLEKMAGKVRYLLIYMAGGIAGNIVSVLYELHTEDYSVSAGASGAIFAVIGALACAVIINKGRIEDYSGRRLLMMAVLSVLQGLTASGINNCAHIGGLVTGFVLALVFYRKLKIRYSVEWYE